MKLVGTDGNRIYSWVLTTGTYVIGRKVESEFYVPNSTVSRKHAQIDVEGNGDLFVTDLGSHNGSTYNGQPLTSRVDLKLGDRITCGDVEFKVADEAEPTTMSARSSSTMLAQKEPEKSVFLSINEALKPLPSNVTELPDVLPTIFEMARTLVLPEPKEKMLQHALDLLAKVVPAERYAILDVEDDSSEVTIAASILKSGKDMGSLTLSRTIIKDILTNKNSILISDASADARFAGQESIIMSALNSAMAVPLFDEGRVLGILYVDTTSPMHHYSHDYLKLLATFGNIIASKLVNFALLSERADRQIFEAELKRASSIQQRLLDIKPMDIDRYEIYAHQDSCRAVGGDMYDFCLLPDGRLLYMVADVSGKGMGAALLMANILASLRILYDNSDFNLIKVVKQVSTQLFKYSGQEDFATLFIGIVDVEKNEMSFVNAGHNPPVLLRADGSHEHLQPSGIMVGAFDMMEWTEDSVSIAPGDFLCVFTDGVTEAEGPECQYGEERLEELLKGCLKMSPKEVADKMMEEINQFTAGCPQSDDITMLILRRTK